MNHCDRCGVKLGDFETIEEFGAALNPVTPEEAALVRIRELSDPLLASCGSYTEGAEDPHGVVRWIRITRLLYDGGDDRCQRDRLRDCPIFCAHVNPSRELRDAQNQSIHASLREG
jgi:hypothetical protein